MSTRPPCACSVKELIDHELTGTPHTDCQPEPYSPAQHSSEPPALNSDALVNTLTAALGTNSTTTTTL